MEIDSTAEACIHTPADIAAVVSMLKQSGSDHPDGLLSLRANYLMWDNK